MKKWMTKPKQLLRARHLMLAADDILNLIYTSRYKIGRMIIHSEVDAGGRTLSVFLYDEDGDEHTVLMACPALEQPIICYTPSMGWEEALLGKQRELLSNWVQNIPARVLVDVLPFPDPFDEEPSHDDYMGYADWIVKESE